MSTTWRKWFVAALVVAFTVTLISGPAVAGKPPKPPNDHGGPRVISYSGYDKLTTMDESGGNTFTVVSDRNADNLAFAGARWSPDGVRLGGYEKRVGDGPFDVALMSIRADGTDEQIVVTYPEVDALNVSNGKSSVYDVDLGPVFHGFNGKAWSPDGRFMVFAAMVVFSEHSAYVPNHSYCLYIVDLSGEEPLRQLTDSPVFFWGDTMPHWSLTENIIVFQSERHDADRSSHSGLWVIKPDGSGMKRIRIGTEDISDLYYRPVWSHQCNEETGHPQIVVHPENQPPMILDVNLGVNPPVATVSTLPDIQMGMPVWSPDDTRLVYSRVVYPPRGARYDEIAILNLGTFGERVLLRTKKSVFTPDWNPVVPTP